MSHPSLAATAVPAGPPPFPLPVPSPHRQTPRQPRPRPRAALRCAHPRRLPLAGDPAKPPPDCAPGQGLRGQAPQAAAAPARARPEGMARLRAARTIHGAYSAETRALNRHDLTALRRGRVGNAAVRHLDRLPPDLAAHLWQMPPELLPPPWPTRGLTPAQDRAVLRAETASLAPWRAAIAQAGFSRRAGKARPRPVAGRPDAPPAEALAPVRAPTAHDTGPTEPFAPFPPAGPAAPAPMPAPDPHAEAHAVPARCAHENAQPEPYVPIPVPTAHDTSATKPFEPFPPAGPAAPATAPPGPARRGPHRPGSSSQCD